MRKSISILEIFPPRNNAQNAGRSCKNAGMRERSQYAGFPPHAGWLTPMACIWVGVRLCVHECMRVCIRFCTMLACGQHVRIRIYPGNIYTHLWRNIYIYRIFIHLSQALLTHCTLTRLLYNHTLKHNFKTHI